MFELESLKFPMFEANLTHLQGKLCYFIEPYDTSKCYSITIGKNNDNYIFKVIDKNGNHLDMKHVDKTFMDYINISLVDIFNIIGAIGLKKCQLFFSITGGEVVLVDVYNGVNYVGPGMIKDVFSKRIKTQKINKIEKCDGTNYTNTIIKPSVFATIDYNGAPYPMYVKLPTNTI